jgi:hypothetical protein
MVLYHLRPYHKLKARQLGVVIRPSPKAPYKIDVFTKEGEYITSIGNRKYKDFIIYAEEEGFDVAERRQALYRKRHKVDSQVEGSRGYFASRILW